MSLIFILYLIYLNLKVNSIQKKFVLCYLNKKHSRIFYPRLNNILYKIASVKAWINIYFLVFTVIEFKKKKDSIKT